MKSKENAKYYHNKNYKKLDKIIKSEYTILSKYREVEQLAARRAHNPEVAGSSPALATKDLIKPYRYMTCKALFFLPSALK